MISILTWNKRRAKNNRVNKFLAFALIAPLLQVALPGAAHAVFSLPTPVITIDPAASATPWTAYSGTTPYGAPSRSGNGTAVSSPYVLSFTGSNFIRFPARNFGNQFTITAWVKPNPTSNINTILANGGANLATNGFKVEWNSWISSDQRIIVEAGNGSTGGTDYTAASPVVTYNNWQQLSYVVNLAPAGGGAPQVQLYRNGSIQCYSGGIPLGIQTSSAWNIGAMMDPSYFMNANLGKLNIYSSALSMSDVQAEYNASASTYLASPPSPSGALVAPTNTGAPVITGAGTVGTSVSSNTGTWNTANSCPTTYTYQWARGTGGSYTNISGASSSSYIVTPADAGQTLQVSVTAVSASGSTVATQTIAVPGSATAPSAPSGVTATPGNTTATVSWTNTFTGTPTVTGYTVTASPGGATCRTTNISLTSCTITGLNNNTDYTFTVVATNSAGNSSPSSASTSVTPFGNCSVTGPTTSGTNYVTYAISGGLCSWLVPANLPVSKLDVVSVGTGVKILTSSVSVGNGQSVTPGTTSYIVTSSASFGYGTPFTLTYNGNTASGTVPTAVTVSGNQSVTLSDNTQSSPLVKTNYAFNGWNTAANGSGSAYASGASFTISANVTLYAQWKQFTLSYISNGATGGFAPPALNGGGNVTVGAGSLSRSGYYFNGWTTSSTGIGGTPYAAGATLNLTANTTLYAVWSKYTLTFNSNSATSGSVPASQLVTGTVTLPANTGSLAKSNYYFAGWYTNSAGTGGTLYAPGASYAVTANTTLYAQFSEYSVTYSLPVGGTFHGNAVTGTVPSPTLGYGNVTTSSNTGSLANTGYAFAGWSDITGHFYAPGATVSLTSNLTLFPYFSQFTLTYDTGTATSGSAPAPLLGAGTITLAGNTGTLAKSNYYFAGWYTNKSGTGGTLYTAGGSYSLTGNVTLYPLWAQYTISYDMTGSTGGSDFSTVGAGVVVLAATSNGYGISGKALSGWSTVSGGGTFYNPGDTFTLTANTTLYPRWLNAGATISVANPLTPGSTSVLTALGLPTDTGSSPFNAPSVSILVTEGAGQHSSSPFVIKYSGANCSISGSANTSFDLSSTGATSVATGFYVTPSAIADCYITITRPSDGTYAESSSNPIDFEFYPINQITPLVVDTTTVGTVYISTSPGVVVQVPGTTVGTLIAMNLLGANIGTGNGAVSYAAYGTNCFMTVSSGSYYLNATTPTRCSVIVTRAASAQWAIATSQTSANFSFVAISQDTFTVGSTQGGGSGLTQSVPFLTQVQLFTVGGSGNGAVTYTSFGTGCTITGNILTSANLGTCAVLAYKSASGYYNGQISTVATYKFTPIDQAPIAIVDDSAAVNSVSPAVVHLSISGGSGSGNVSYSAYPSPACVITVVDSFTATLSSTNSGNCTVTAYKSSSGGYNGRLSASVKYFFGSTPDVPLAISLSTSTSSVNVPILVTTTGGYRGAGAGAITIARYGNNSCILSSPDTVNGTVSVVSSLTGSCNLQATQAAGASYVASITPLVTASFTGGSQASLNLSFDPAVESSTATQSTATMHVFASGGSGTGKFTYSVQSTNGATGCAITPTDPSVTGNASYATLVTSTPGTCLVTVVKSGDGSYAFATSTTPFVFTGITQPPLLLTPDKTSAAALSNVVVTLTGGAGTGAVTYAVSGANCSLSSPTSTNVTLTASNISSCYVSASKAADSTYSAAKTLGSNSAIVNFGRSAQSPLVLVVDSLSSGYSTSKGADLTYLLTTSGGSGNGVVTFNAFGNGNCILDTSTVGYAVLSTTFSVVTCNVVASKAGDATTYAGAQTATVPLSFVAATQAPLSISGDNTNVAVGASINLTTVGGSGIGAYRYLANNTPSYNPSCVLNGSNTDTSTVTASSIGTCSVTVVKAGSGLFGSQAATTVTFTFGSNQTPLALNPVSTTTSSAVAGLATTLQLTGGSGTGTVTFSSGACTVSYDAGTGIVTVTAPYPTTCVISAHQASDGNYFAATSNSITVTFAAQSQAALTISATPTSALAGDTITVTALGGSGTGAYKFALYQTGANCSIISFTSDSANNRATAYVTRSNSGVCSIAAVRSGSGVYGSAVSQTLALVWGTIAQPIPLTISNDPTFASVGETITVTTKGGAGLGAITFTDIKYDPTCKLNTTTGQLYRATYGTCTIRATKGSDGVYGSQNSQNIVFTFYGSTVQSPLVISTTTLTSSVGTSISLSTTGGSSGGTVSYIIVGGTGTGTISGNTLSATSAGTLIISATKQGDVNYASVVSLAVTFTFTA